ncbi:MAG: NAD(P)H-dependent oxidoreductase subunit E [Tepidisphaerales bacterium]
MPANWDFSRFAGRRGTLLVALQEIQDERGFIPGDAVAPLAAAFDITEAEVRGVIEFYRALRTSPPGRHRVGVCRGDSCAALGAKAIAGAVDAHLAAISDVSLTGESAFCLGACAVSPAVAIDGEVHGRLTPDDAVRLLREVARD